MPAPTTEQLTSILGGLNQGLNAGTFDATQALAALNAGTSTSGDFSTGIGSNLGNASTFQNLTFTPEQQGAFSNIFGVTQPASTPTPSTAPTTPYGATGGGAPNLNVPYGSDYLDPAAAYTLKALELEQQQKQFDASQQAEAQRLAQQQAQFDSQLAFDKQVFEQQLAIQQQQQLLDEQQAAEQRRQFDIQQAEQKRQFDQNMAFQQQRLVEDKRQFDVGLAAEQQRAQLQLQENARQFNVGTVSDVAKTMANLRAQGPASAAELAFYQAGLGLPAFGSAANIENLLGATTRGATGSLPLDFNVPSTSPLLSMLGGGGAGAIQPAGPAVPLSEGNPIAGYLQQQQGGQPMFNIPNTLSGQQLAGLNANPNLAGVTASFAQAAGNPDIFTRSINALVPSGFAGVGSPYG